MPKRWNLLFLMLCILISTFLMIVLIIHGSEVTDRRNILKFKYESDDAAQFKVINDFHIDEFQKVSYTRSAEELTRVKQCQKTAQKDRNWSWEMFLKDRNVCVLHHTYLKKKDTVVIEVGGNIGTDALQMVKMYKHRHIILEPVVSYASGLREKFKNDSRITVLNFGLGRKSETQHVKVNGDATSIFAKAPGHIPVYVMNSTEFFLHIGVGVFSIDLLTMDCEGCELDVIENLISTKMIIYVKNIQFESHGHLKGFKNENWIERYCLIQEDLGRTHRLTFQYKHVWENWRRNDLQNDIISYQ